MQGAYDFTSHIVLIWNLDPIETSKMCHRLRSGSRLACTQRPDAGGGWYLRTRAVWKCSKDYDYLLQSDADAAKEKMKGLPET